MQSCPHAGWTRQGRRPGIKNELYYLRKKKKKDFDIVSGFAVLFQYLKRTFGYLYLRHIHYG